ncbi:MAG: PIN domain-containing protein [Bryobacteraceae bacterium]
MNVIVVDTSAWVSYFRGIEAPDLDIALREGRVLLAPIVAAELLSGEIPAARERALIEFLEELPLCDASFDHWVRVGLLRRALRQRGVFISTPDAHVAQCCIDVRGYLLTEDKIFRQIASAAGLRLL